jgi:signal transduction histidine kinase
MTEVPATRILIVDDEAPQMKALCDTLRDEGYEAAGFTSGQDALAALREKSFDLLLTDLMMPEMDGIALLRAAQEVDRQLVGIVMTGHGTINTAVEAMQVGAIDYVLKPFKLSAAIPVISRALAMRRLRVENAKLEQLLHERNAALEAMNDELEAFASSVAHDLHAPARHIAGYAEILLEDCAGELSENAQRHLQTISGAAERMGQLISDLLAFSRLARSEMHRRPVNLGELVTRVRGELEYETRGRAIVWKVADLPTVEADHSLLRQVFYNLLSNAIKYTRKRETATIEIGCREEPGELVCFVRDNGAGFDMRYVEKIFRIFQRLHRADEFEGNGVGLSSVQRIVHRHGGRIWAEAEVDRGAVFTFTLPRSGSG